MFNLDPNVVQIQALYHAKEEFCIILWWYMTDEEVKLYLGHLNSALGFLLSIEMKLTIYIGICSVLTLRER